MASTAITKPTRQQSESSFLSLPVDLVKCIIDQLQQEHTPEDVACLAMTCKSMWTIAGDVFRRPDNDNSWDDFRLTPQTYFNFQKRWERDFGGEKQYCTGCRRLVNGDHPEDCGASKHRFHPGLSKKDVAFLPIHACAVLKQHHDPHRAGLPKSVFEKNSAVKWDPSTWHATSKARVIHGDLMMLVEHTWEGRKAAFHKLARNEDYYVCKHYCVDDLEIARRSAVSSGDDGKCVRGVCSHCETSIDMNIEPTPGRNCKVTIKAYHNMGRCERPNTIPFHQLLVDDSLPFFRRGLHVCSRCVWEDELHRLAVVEFKADLNMVAQRRHNKRMMKVALRPLKRPSPASLEADTLWEESWAKRQKV